MVALEFLRAASKEGIAKFPLSLAHYLETTKHSKVERRKRLADFMIEISQLHTIASLEEVLAHEIDASLRVYFGGRIAVKPLHLLGKGVGHALGTSTSRGFQVDDSSVLLAPEERQRIEAMANAMFELGALAGPDTIGAPDSRNREAQDTIDDTFVETLRELPQDVGSLPDNQLIRDVFLVGRCIGDIRVAIESRIAVHGISWDEFQSIGPVELMRFVYRMPSRRVDLHLMHQFSKDRNLKRERNDLNDFGYLGLACAYCDVVVAEKQFTDLVNRGGLEKKAVVISDLRELPNV